MPDKKKAPALKQAAATQKISKEELQELIKKAEQDGLSGDEALNAAFEANARDVARIGGG